MVLIGHLEFFLGSRSGQDLLLLQEATEHARVVYFHILIILPAEFGLTNLRREHMQFLDDIMDLEGVDCHLEFFQGSRSGYHDGYLGNMMDISLVTHNLGQWFQAYIFVCAGTRTIQKMIHQFNSATSIGNILPVRATGNKTIQNVPNFCQWHSSFRVRNLMLSQKLSG